MSKLINAINNTPMLTTTKNGAIAYDRSGSSVLDLFSRGGALRSTSDSELISLFNKAFTEDSLLALKCLFYLRDIRGGQGERKVFRTILTHVAKSYPIIFTKNMDNIVKFGRYDDLFVAFGTKSEDAMTNFIRVQLEKDAFQTDNTKLSLLAKWLPSENTSSSETRALAKKFISALGVTPRVYRKTLSKIRSKLNLVEIAMSVNAWAQIDFEKVPSKANLLYKKAFKRQQEDRYNAFLASVEKGEAKINAGTLYPYEFIRDLYKNGTSDRKTLNALWNSLPDFTKDNPHNGLVIADVSGSMTSGNGDVKPIWVSISLAIYFAQRNKGFFKDHFMTFSENSKLVKITSPDIVDAYSQLQQSEWGMSTNLQSAFNAILSAAKANNLSQEDLPSVLYVISDMQFNVACGGNTATNFDAARLKFEAAGYKLPTICFWNVNATSGTSPVSRDTTGATLVSGCSPSIFKTVLTGSTVTPYDNMQATLNSDRYASVSQ